MNFLSRNTRIKVVAVAVFLKRMNVTTIEHIITIIKGEYKMLIQIKARLNSCVIVLSNVCAF